MHSAATQHMMHFANSVFKDMGNMLIYVYTSLVLLA